MNSRPVLRELSRSLSERERKELLDKINRSINLTDSSDTSIYPKKMNDEEREILIEHDMQNASFFARFLLWIRSIVTGKNKREIFLELKMSSLKSTIQKRTPGLTGFETRNLSPKTAQEFFSLFVLVNPLIPLYRKIWSDTNSFENALIGLLERTLPEPKKDLLQLVSNEEMEEVYAKTGLKEKVRDLVSDRIEAYIEHIPAETFAQLEDQIKPVYYLKEVVLFPYLRFFKLFHYTPQPTDEKPLFKSASAILSLEYLEKMFYAVYTVTKIEEPISLDKKFAQHLLSSTGESVAPVEDTVTKDTEKQGEAGQSGEDEPLPDELLPEESESTISEQMQDDAQDDDTDYETGRELVLSVQRVLRGVHEFSKAVPLVELIRFFKKDPYYQLIFYIPKLYLKEFYLSILKIRFIPKVDEVFPEIRNTVIEKKIQDLFRGKRLSGFLYYRDYTSTDFSNLGLPTFSHDRSANLLYNYIRQFYRGTIQELVQILSRGLLKTNRITLNRLLLHAASVEDLEDKLKSFDTSLSPDEEDGKLFQRIRHSLASDSTHQRLFRNLVVQKDKEVESLLEKGKESFLGIKKIFDELLSSPMESVKQKLHTHYMVNGRSQSLEELLKNQSNHIDKFHRLLQQLSKIERGF